MGTRHDGNSGEEAGRCRTQPTQRPVGHEVHLGKLEVKPDSRNLQLARYIESQVVLPQVPEKVDWSQAVSQWPMYKNDALGDCTCAAAGHMEEAWSANASEPEVPSEKAILDLYWATGTEDTGRYCLDVLNYWQKTGLGGETVKAFAQVDPHRREYIELGCWMFGGVYIGVALPASAKHQRTSGRSFKGRRRRPDLGAATASTWSTM